MIHQSNERVCIFILREILMNKVWILEFLTDFTKSELRKMLSKYKKHNCCNYCSLFVLICFNIKVTSIDYLHHFSKYLIGVLSWELKFRSKGDFLLINEEIPLIHVPWCPHERCWRSHEPFKFSHHFLFNFDYLLLSVSIISWFNKVLYFGR